MQVYPILKKCLALTFCFIFLLITEVPGANIPVEKLECLDNQTIIDIAEKYKLTESLQAEINKLNKEIYFLNTISSNQDRLIDLNEELNKKSRGQIWWGKHKAKVNLILGLIAGGLLGYALCKAFK